MSNKKSLQLKALKRNSPAGGEDGGCDEFLNMRLEKGAFRPIGPKKEIYPKVDYEKVVVHRQDDFENWIGYDGTSLLHYNPVDTSVILDLGEVEGELFELRSLKNFLLAITSAGTRFWLWSDDTYGEVSLEGLEDRFDVELTQDEDNVAEPDWTDYTEDYVHGYDPTDDELDSAVEQMLGYYYKKVNEFSNDSKFVGGVTYRVALRLFDGSYVLHSVPRFYKFYPYDMLFGQGYWSEEMRGHRLRFGAAGVKARAMFDNSGGFDFEGLQKVVSSIDIFFSKNEQFYDISDDTITPELLKEMMLLYTDNALVNKQFQIQGNFADELLTTNAYDHVGVASDFKGINDSPAWYKVGTIDLGSLEVVNTVLQAEMDLDLEDFYQNYATRSTLTVDGYSHHASTGEASYVYNNRLALGNTTQFLASPNISPLKVPMAMYGDDTAAIRPLAKNLAGEYVEFTYDELLEGKVVVELSTENGTKRVVNDISLPVYKNGLLRNIFMDPITGYFDSRATTLKIYVSEDDGANYSLLKTINLSASKYSNYSYVEPNSFEVGADITPDYPILEPRRYDVNFEGWMIPMGLIISPVTVPSATNVAQNNNGRQVSNVSNPLVFDPLNFQDVSTGTILAFGSNTDPISDSQFGSYPLYNFTSRGIWASKIGTGEVYILSDVPVNGEVILDKDSKLDLSLGTVYATLDGLKILSGRTPVEISTPVDGPVEVAFTSNAQLQKFLNLPQTLDVQDVVDQVPFNTYLLGATLGYSKGLDAEEIYVANPDYQYMYMFDIDTKLWTKVSGNVKYFINFYPELYAMGDSYTLNISLEDEGLTPVYFHTKPLALGSYEVFKKLRRSFLRGFINTASGKYAAFYLFGSDDLVEWEFITGNDYNSGSFKDIWCTHSFGSKRYYVFVFAAEMDYSPNKVSYINGIEFEADEKWSSKLR